MRTMDNNKLTLTQLKAEVYDLSKLANQTAKRIQDANAEIARLEKKSEESWDRTQDRVLREADG